MGCLAIAALALPHAFNTEHYLPREDLERIESGTPRDEAEKILGTPDAIEPRPAGQPGFVLIWRGRTSSVDGVTCTGDFRLHVDSYGRQIGEERHFELTPLPWEIAKEYIRRWLP
jgi:hypothetical protein